MKCPFCAEQIADEAIKCKHCGSVIDKVKMAGLSINPSEAKTPSKRKLSVVHYIGIVVAIGSAWIIIPGMFKSNEANEVKSAAQQSEVVLQGSKEDDFIGLWDCRTDTKKIEVWQFEGDGTWKHFVQDDQDNKGFRIGKWTREGKDIHFYHHSVIMVEGPEVSGSPLKESYRNRWIVESAEGLDRLNRKSKDSLEIEALGWRQRPTDEWRKSNGGNTICSATTKDEYGLRSLSTQAIPQLSRQQAEAVASVAEPSDTVKEAPKATLQNDLAAAEAEVHRAWDRLEATEAVWESHGCDTRMLSYEPKKAIRSMLENAARSDDVPTKLFMFKSATDMADRASTMAKGTACQP